jgi:hypothetical protein
LVPVVDALYPRSAFDHALVVVVGVARHGLDGDEVPLVLKSPALPGAVSAPR